MHLKKKQLLDKLLFLAVEVKCSLLVYKTKQTAYVG